MLDCFADTGKEVEQTLELVRGCSGRWAIVWLDCRIFLCGDGPARGMME